MPKRQPRWPSMGLNSCSSSMRFSRAGITVLKFGAIVTKLKTVLPALLKRVEDLHEFNPMLGHRGCRLGITYPEITEMQARAILEAAVQAMRRGIVVKPEIMIPLVSTVKEF